jgi:EAL domain-containing protein (putative c-di-GMP-specific phosphodiesterase class I)
MGLLRAIFRRTTSALVMDCEIDQSFVAGLTKNTDDAAIVKALITLEHCPRLNVVAEGVETSCH